MNGHKICERSEHHEKALLFSRSHVLLVQGSSHIETGDKFYIEAQVDGQVALGETWITEALGGVVVSQEIIELPEVDFSTRTGGGFGGGNMGGMRELMEAMRAIELEVFWDNPNEELHFVIIENAEADQESIFPDLGGF